jgi:hypothetical protein
VFNICLLVENKARNRQIYWAAASRAELLDVFLFIQRRGL